MSTLAANRYAGVFFSKAEKDNLRSELLIDFQSFTKAFETEAFVKFMSNAATSNASKLVFIKKSIGDKLQSQTLNFLDFLCSKNRMMLLEAISTAYIALDRKAKGVVEGKLISAYSMSETQIAQLSQKLKELYNKDYILTQDVDPSLKGGFIVHLEGLVIDCSLTSRIEDLKVRLLAKP
jgi:F-type H+-transporting ATPase subunit delta